MRMTVTCITSENSDSRVTQWLCLYKYQCNARLSITRSASRLFEHMHTAYTDTDTHSFTRGYENTADIFHILLTQR